CLALKEQYKEDNDPVRQFFAECCQFRQGKFKVIKDNDYTRREIYSTYKYWYKENVSSYYNSVSEKKFKDDILEILAEGEIEKDDAIFKYNGGRYYAITLNDDGKKYYNEFMFEKARYRH
ncbi:MAG: primase-like DNA-binding domain-containing protein, partial [Clostridia bacterium]|nr:primase-like DNA-binding domain-containing protein [Clostridia bacterium]